MNADALLARTDLGSDAWWHALRVLGTPLRRVRDDASLELDFFWRDAEAAAVYIDVWSHTPHVSTSPTALQRVDGSDVWHWRTRLPADWRGSYFFVPVMADALPVPPSAAARRDWWIALMARHGSADPCNPLPPHGNGRGLALSAIVPPDERPHEPMRAQPAAALETWSWNSARLRNRRDVWLYRTAAADARALPLLILLDGQCWARDAALLAALATHTRDGLLPPAQYLFIDALDAATRARELCCAPEFWLALQEEVLPRVAAQRAAGLQARDTVVVGQSFGGLAAVHAALHWPQRYGAALSQSGSFWWPDPQETGTGGWLTQQIRAGLADGCAAPLHIEIGCYETDMLGVNRALHAALRDAGCRTQYREFRGGHDWLCWRHELPAALARLFAALHAPRDDATPTARSPADARTRIAAESV
ncbi:MAG: enterochelin esterase [Solimonas sp.]